MPAYDSIVGARLDANRAPDRAAAEAQFARAVSGDDLSAGDRQRELDALAAIPGVIADFVIESEDGPRYLLVIEGGKQATFDIIDSRAADRIEPARGTFRPKAQTKVPVDELIELVADVAEDIEEVGDNAAELPYFWPDLDEMIAILAKAGPLLRGKLEMLAEVDDRRYDVEVANNKVTCVPLHPLCGAHTAQVLAIADIAVRDTTIVVPFAKPPKPKPAPKFDPARPFVTGSKTQREDAWSEYTEYGRKKMTELASSIAAVQDEANRDKRYDELRRRIYHFLAKYDVPEVHAVWLWALREESDEVAETVTYIGWRLEGLIPRLADALRDAEARSDKQTAGRIRRLQSEAR